MTALLCALSLVVLTQAPAVSVSFDLRSLSEQDYRRWDGVELERKVALRLIQEGFAVVSPRSPAQLRLRASRSPEGLWLEAAGPRQRVEQGVRVGRGSLAELHLEVAQKLSEMTRAVQPEPEPPPPEPALPPPVEVAAAPWRPELDLSLGLGTLWRGRGTDPLLLLSVRRGVESFGLEAEAGLGVSREAALTVFEAQGGAFFSYRRSVAERLQLEPGVGAGLVVHAFRLKDAWMSGQSGTQVSPAGWARMKLRWRFTERLAAELRVALGLLRPVTHVSEGGTLWSRGGARLETGVQLSWGQ
ncbi:hypothetical protein COCOR_02891 [Corallococcus coralloides DSM 2259]|uniref:Uncharacterized protein n=1 Tax=Corallococcus coralloides (strain ATCC 25202 / DSM 2259 / NBRC 100086 / M2) TaxID=1144275 RepID=H8MYN2_CORCM|nr:hypothetical protein [Corallococcus coralloides]AFE04902.1 hypothetical protein COCOR_02891 [Corallococcus coralloides DSM 2259]